MLGADYVSQNLDQWRYRERLKTVVQYLNHLSTTIVGGNPRLPAFTADANFTGQLQKSVIWLAVRAYVIEVDLLI
ncbi:hypothetical protein HDU81_009864 [Chytriomyces hyalinus]|nr:hypothetical protein HDU81_009864 [Chytriomyces hyalinus]